MPHITIGNISAPIVNLGGVIQELRKLLSKVLNTSYEVKLANAFYHSSADSQSQVHSVWSAKYRLS